MTTYHTSRKPQPTAAERMERKRAAKEQREAQKETERIAAEEQRLATLGFDYSELDEVKRDRLQLAVFNIRRCERRAVQDLSTIGQELIAVKAIMPDKFTEWIDREFGYSNGSAHDFMNMARRHAQFPNFGNLGISSARLLSAPSIPDAAIVQACEIAVTAGKITLAETREIIRTHKPPKPKQLPPPPVPQLTGPVAEPEPDDAIDAEYTVVPEPLSFADWLAVMPPDLSLREQLAVLSLAKTTALHALGDHPKLYNAVYGALPTWSALIHKIEQELKHE